MFGGAREEWLAQTPWQLWLDRTFRLSHRGSSPRTEIMAGLTTFFTMAYILFVNPSILAAAGMDKQAVLMATALACAFGSITMGLVANLPFALAPGMGMNAFFAFTVVAQLHIPWQTALAAVFFDGCLFLVLSILPIRERIIKEIPYNMKLATASGIGLFITFIGLRSADIVVNYEATAVKMGDISQPAVLLTMFGLLFTAWMLARGVRGALLWGIIAVTTVGFVVPSTKGGMVTEWPGWDQIFELPRWEVLGRVAFDLDLVGAWNMGLLVIIFTFTFVSLFDTAGTFVGLGTKLGWIDEERPIFPGAGRGLVVESLAIMFGAIAGTSTTSTYVESASGIAEGGRTGMVAVTAGLLFLLALFLAPLAMIIPAQATAPALILVGFLMLEPILKLKLDDFTEAVPAFLTLIAIPFTYNIANGLIWGTLSYVFLKVTTGRVREVNLTTWFLAIIFVLSFKYHLH